MKRNYSPEALKKLKQYKIDYNHKNYKTVTLRLNREKDTEIINHLIAQENSTEYIRKLVRADIKKKKK